jgi:FkbM family methyltransferase
MKDHGHYLNCAITKLMDRLTPVTMQDGIKFYCPSFLALWRAETLLTKEPETIQWIDTFHPIDVFWDIGANIGCYSLYAAKKGFQAIAFEPSAYNFFVLQKNIELNGFYNRMVAYCLSLNESFDFGSLLLSDEGIGGAENTFGGIGTQGSVAWSVDELVFKHHLPPPDHIKIDVDGNEMRILEGAKITLQAFTKSALVESTPENKDNIIAFMSNCGFEDSAYYGANCIFWKQPHSFI